MSSYYSENYGTVKYCFLAYITNLCGVLLIILSVKKLHIFLLYILSNI